MAGRRATPRARIAISCLESEWERIREVAESRGVSINDHVISAGLGVQLDPAQTAAPALALSEAEQRRLLDRVDRLAESMLSAASAKYPLHRCERFLTDAEFERLSRALDDAEIKGGTSAGVVAAIRLLMLTGCRKNEIPTLRWRDVDLAIGELTLVDAKPGPRAVPLAPSAVRLLAGLAREPGSPWVIPGHKPGTHMRSRPPRAMRIWRGSRCTKRRCRSQGVKQRISCRVSGRRTPMQGGGEAEAQARQPPQGRGGAAQGLWEVGTKRNAKGRTISREYSLSSFCS